MIRPALFVLTLVISPALAWSQSSARLPLGDTSDFDALGDRFQSEVVPLLEQYCLECHRGEAAEAEVDFEHHRSDAGWRQSPEIWQRTREMLRSGQMPPEDSKQLSDTQSETLLTWVRAYLKAESESRGGDPGPVTLRRLSNAEYTYTLRDLTGVDSLSPAAEFPIDGAAGEGFTNVGDGLVMSPSLVNKYLEAAKEVAGHLVLLPDGIEFSRYTTRRDWTDQWLARIQAIYHDSTADDGGTSVDLQGIKFSTNEGGRLAVEKYLAALMDERASLAAGTMTIEELARRRGLSAKYLTTLWNKLTDAQVAESNFLLAALQQRFSESPPDSAAEIAADIEAWQKALWKFNSVGQFGRDGGPKAWMEAITPVLTRQPLKLTFPDLTATEQQVFYLLVRDAAADGGRNTVVFKNFRLQGGDRPQLLLRDVAGIAQRRDELRAQMLSQSSQYLAAVAQCRRASGDADGQKVDVIAAADSFGIDAGLLKVWLRYLSMADDDPVTVGGHFVDAVPKASLLWQWRNEKDPAKRSELAQRIQDLANGDSLAEPGSPDAILYQQLHLLEIPLDHPRLTHGIDPDPRFGRHPMVGELAPQDFAVTAPAIVKFTVAADLATGGEVAVEAEVNSYSDGATCVQVELLTEKPESSSGLDPSLSLLVAEGSALAHVRAAIEEFRDLFPPALCYSQIVPVDEVVTLTLFFREDDHLKRLMLDEDNIAELDRLWDELLYISREPLQLVVSLEQLSEFATQDRPDLVDAFAPLREPVADRAQQFRNRLVETEPLHLSAIVRLADRAWRRPLHPHERAELRSLYQRLRDLDIEHEQAIRLTLARVLTSPDFLYRRETAPAGQSSSKVTDGELACRLSYFLWSSLPDDQLRELARQGKLSEESTLRAETQRMLRDPRARRLAEQFACQWLHIRDFDQTVEKNEKLYPEFADLRAAMYEEAVRFFEDMFRTNGSILGMVDADHTFVNEALARHYGIEGIRGSQWRRVDDVRRLGRGGVLGMASVLASQSGASRTSPILRGNWVYETLLGERLPRPPAGVPQLPDQAPTGLTARQLIEQHSGNPGCAKCHAKIDPFGFSLEQFDAIGRRRPDDVDTETRLRSGELIDGIDGLKEYLVELRRDDLVRQFSRKLLGYALGREVQLSDEPLLETMHRELAAEGYRFHTAVGVITSSPQFRQIRGRDFVQQ